MCSHKSTDLHVWGFRLTACKVSILSAPVILTAISLKDATLTLHWIGRVKVLDWFCTKRKTEISPQGRSYRRWSWKIEFVENYLGGLYFTKREKRERSSGEALLCATCWGGKQWEPSLCGRYIQNQRRAQTFLKAGATAKKAHTVEFGFWEGTFAYFGSHMNTLVLFWLPGVKFIIF